MEEKLLQIFKLADILNEKQDKVYAQIRYAADDKKTLEILIRSKQDFSHIEKCEIQLTDNSLFRLDNVTALFEKCIGGIENE